MPLPGTFSFSSGYITHIKCVFKLVGPEPPHPCVIFLAQTAPPDWCAMAHQRCGFRVDCLPHPMKAACEGTGSVAELFRRA